MNRLTRAGSRVPNRRPAPVALFMLATAFALSAGCTHAILYDSPYYEHGPEQLEAPQGTFSAGTEVWAFERRGSYRRVWSSSFVNAFVHDAYVVPISRYRDIRRAQKEAESSRKSSDGESMKPAKEKSKSKRKEPQYKPL